MGWPTVGFCVIVLLAEIALANVSSIRGDNDVRFKSSFNSDRRDRQFDGTAYNPNPDRARFRRSPKLPLANDVDRMTPSVAGEQIEDDRRIKLTSNEMPKGISNAMRTTGRYRKLTPIQEPYTTSRGAEDARVQKLTPIDTRSTRRSYGMRARARTRNVAQRQARPLGFSAGGTILGGVHSNIQDAVDRARHAALSVSQYDREGCMDPQDANYNRMASIHNAAICDKSCSEATERLLPTIDPESISELSREEYFAIAIDISWKYLEATLSFHTDTGARAHKQIFRITSSEAFDGGSSMRVTRSGDDVWTRGDYKRQCYDTFIAKVPWTEMAGLLWEMPEDSNTLQGIIEVTTLESIIFDSAINGGRDIPEMNRTWQGVLPFAMKLPGDVTVVGNNAVAP